MFGVWALGIRLALRDLRRDKVPAALAAGSVLLPVLLLSILACLLSTWQISPAERVIELSGRQAKLSLVAEQVVAQRPTGETNLTEQPATPVPGYRTGEDVFANAAAIGAVAGAPVTPVGEWSGSVRFEGRVVRAAGVSIAKADDPLVRIRGQAPAADDEILVGAPLVRQGVPEGGSVDLSIDGQARRVTIVGTVEGALGGRVVEILGRPGLATADAGYWLTTAPTPVSWGQVKALNTYGIPVLSAATLTDPPRDAHVTGAPEAPTSAGLPAPYLVVAGILLVIVVALLAAPSLAVASARRRRSLAILASNGATSGHLRCIALSMALVLGVAAAVAGAAVGVASAAILFAWLRSTGRMWLPPLDIPWLALGGLVIVGSLAALIAALGPARGLTSLELVGSARGGHVAPPAGRRLFRVSAGVAAVAVGVFALAFLGAVRDFTAAWASIAFLVALLGLVPTLLQAVGHLGGRLPLPLRLGARDLARQRSRSVPVVAALLAGMAALTMVSVATTSDDRQRQLEYQPETSPGDARLVQAQVDESGNRMWFSGYGSDAVYPAADLPRTRAMIEGAAGDAIPGAQVGSVQAVLGAAGAATRDELWSRPVAPVRAGCAPERALAGDPDCDAGEAEILVMSRGLITRLFALTPTQAAALDGGALVLNPALVAESGVTIVGARVARDADSGAVTSVDITETTRLAAITPERIAPEAAGYAVIVASDVAAAQGWALGAPVWFVHDPTGPIGTVAEQVLAGGLTDQWDVEVERGYDDSAMRYFRWGIAGIFGLLLLTVTVTSAALATVEQRAQQATLAAVGATRRTRRLLSAGQAIAVGAFGGALGLMAGLLPGLALAYALTREHAGGATIVVPWPTLLIVGLGVPLVAALVSALAVRSDPLVTRRLAVGA